MHLLRTSAAAFIAAALLAGPVQAQTLTEALSAYRSNRVAEAETMLQAVAANPASSASDRAAAQRELGRIDWLIRAETDGAAAALAQAGDAPARCRALLLTLRVTREAGAPQTGLEAAAQGRGDCNTSEAEDMNVAIARAHLAQAQLTPANAAQHLDAASAAIAAIDPVARRAPSNASAALSVALARRDANAAFAAWRDYLWLDDADAPQALASYRGHTRAIFTTSLAANATEADRIALVDLLVRAGFADDARALAGAMSDNPNWDYAKAYFTFNAAVRDITLRTNRALARGERVSDYQAQIQAAMGALMQAANLSGDPREALRLAYGLYGTIGETGGYPSLHGGHLVQDEVLHVAQYGREGELRFIIIDNMLANGFESWLWDGWAEAGGWATDDGAIVQVRSAYTDGPLNALRRSREGGERTRFVAEMEASIPAELAALGRDGVAELPATSDRLQLQAIDQIAAQASDPAAFIDAYWNAMVGYSINLHEGRHALDKASGNFSSPDLEYRAKLSQIALSPYPRLGLGNVAGGTQNSTSHGRANRRLLEGFRNWMRRHRAEITGFDATKPALAQLDLLTDAQIRAAAASLDPWAR